jgi:hypothetical protein
MRLILFALSVWLAAPVPSPPQEAPKPPAARISGRVVAADTGRPLQWATVRLVSSDGRQTMKMTDGAGRFSFDALPAGSYTLDARRERYVPMDAGGRPYSGLAADVRRPIRVRDGEHFDRADFKLPRGGAIEGRLLDEFGDPAPGLMVQVSQGVFAGGRRRLLPVTPGRSLQSDDRGHFRVHGLVPGTYYLSVLSGVFAEGAQAGGFAPTYFPGTTDLASAQPLTVGAGQQVVNLTFPLTPARMARISGRAVDDEGRPVPSANLVISTADSLGVSDFHITRATGNPDGTFVLRNVPPGRFTLQGYGRPPAGGPMNLNAAPFGWMPLTVTGVDQNDLVLRIVTGPSLRGRIVADDPAGPELDPTRVYVTASPVQFDSAPVAGGPPPYEVNPDGTFEVKNMSGLRTIRVSFRDPGWTLARITRNGRDITDDVVDFKDGEVDDVEVVATNRVASVHGTVTDRAGDPVSDYTVVVFAADPAKWGPWSRFVMAVRAAQDGSFVMRGLPPGDYYAVALPGTIGTMWQDPEFLKPLRDEATGLLVGPGEAKKVPLKLLDR